MALYSSTLPEYRSLKNLKGFGFTLLTLEAQNPFIYWCARQDLNLRPPDS